ncbi:hypothetical protein T484DRAFT_1646548, partial [Baffinella frigidus]
MEYCSASVTCDADQYALEGVCQPCPDGTSSASAEDTPLESCVCKAGYTAASDGVVCTACAGGTYKIATGSGECIACGTNLYSMTVAAVAAESCLA